MADYYSILTKTIAGLPSNTADTRSMVYAKARTAIDKQLRTRDPAPSEEVIGRQLEMLEEAIEKVEANASIDQAISELNNAEEVPVENVTETELNKVASVSDMSAVSRSPDDTILEETKNDVPESVGIEDPGALDPAVVAEAPPAPAKVDEVPPVMVAQSQGDTDAPPQKNVALRIIPYLISLIIVAGGAYALWMNQATLISALDNTINVSGNQESTTEKAETDSQPTSEASDRPVRVVTPEDDASKPSQKENVRLSESGESVEVEPVVPEPVTEPLKEGDTPIILDEDVAQPSDVTNDQNVEVSEVQNNGNQPESGDQTEAQPATPTVGQNAFLYEEGASGSGAARIPATIVWSLASEPPSEGLPSEPVIKGKLTVPDRGLNMDLSLKRNTDAGLPASHIIELIFEAPSDFAGGQIDNVARFVLKATEQARGDGLVAVPAKISNGYFLIALNNLPQAIETNTKLLTESDWIDIPMGYTTGRRALVTLEKGAVGDKVFRDAFADWKNR